MRHCAGKAPKDTIMKRLSIACLAALLLGLAAPATAQTNNAALVQFYQDYLALVSSSDYVTTSRDAPEVWDEHFDSIARNAGFTDAADAMAAGEAMAATDSDIASLRQAVAGKILQEYKPYQE
jgi:hypothetical protein